MEEFIKIIIKEAGAIALAKFGKARVEYSKSDAADLVTETDLEINKFLVEKIKSKYPDHGIISEEADEHQKNAEYVWIIDPIDGTRNFATRTPLFGVMIGFAKNKEMRMAAVYDPIQDELFFAEKGKGTFRNGERVHCSDKKEWAYSFGCGPADLHSKIKINFMRQMLDIAEKEPIWISSFGSISITAIYLADGRRDWFCGTRGRLWDYAPVSIILTEAGCTVTNMKGKPWTFEDEQLIAANPHLHPRLLEIAQKL